MSVHDLMRGMSLNSQQPTMGFVVPPEREEQVDNSEGMRETLAGTKAKRKRVLDRYYADQNIEKREARNASGFSIRQSYKPRYYDDKEWNFYLDNSIDPNKIRSVEHPDSAMPLDNSVGTEGAYIQLDMDDFRAYSENGLFMKAMQNYMAAKGAYGLQGFQPEYIPADVVPVPPKK